MKRMATKWPVGAEGRFKYCTEHDLSQGSGIFFDENTSAAFHHEQAEP